MNVTFDQAHAFLRNVYSCVVDQSHLGRLIVGMDPNEKPFILIDSTWHRLVEEVNKDRPIVVTESGSFLFYTTRVATESPVEVLALIPKRFV